MRKDILERKNNDEYITLNGTGKSDFLHTFMNELQSEECFAIILEDKNVSCSLFSEYDYFVLDEAQSIKDEMKKYLNIVENWSDKLKYLIIYSTEKSEKDMINGDVYYLLNQIKEKPFFKDMTAIVVCK